MIEQTLEKSESKICEACGEVFSCGANSEECWCFRVDLSAETLAELQQNFKSCLCKNCLVNQNFKQNEPGKRK